MIPFMVSVQHCGDLFILETSEEKRTELPDAVWKKLTIVCGIISYSRFPNFESLRIQYHLFDNLSWLQITGREEQFLFDEQFYSNPCSTEEKLVLVSIYFFIILYIMHIAQEGLPHSTTHPEGKTDEFVHLFFIDT